MPARVVDGVVDRRLGDLVEHHPLHRHLRLQVLEEVPADGFALAVLVGREVELDGVLQRRPQVLDHLLAAFGQLVRRLEPVVDVDGETLRRQVGDVAHRGAHVVVVAEELRDRLGLRGRLDDDEGLGHRCLWLEDRAGFVKTQCAGTSPRSASRRPSTKPPSSSDPPSGEPTAHPSVCSLIARSVSLLSVSQPPTPSRSWGSVRSSQVRCGAMQTPSAELGWADDFDASWVAVGSPGTPGRVSRLDRGWSTVLVRWREARGRANAAGAQHRRRRRRRRLGGAVRRRRAGRARAAAASARSCGGRRSRAAGPRSHTLAANIDVVFLIHALGVAAQPAPPRARARAGVRQRRRPVVVLTKPDLVERPEPAAARVVERGASACRSLRRERHRRRRRRRAARLRGRQRGRWRCSGRAASASRRSSTRCSAASVAGARPAVREGDQRGRHTTVAAELVRCPARAG